MRIRLVLVLVSVASLLLSCEKGTTEKTIAAANGATRTNGLNVPRRAPLTSNQVATLDLESLKPYADEGDGGARLELVRRCFVEEEAPSVPMETMRNWVEKMASQDPDAELFLALCDYGMQGLPKNLLEAERHLRSAAERGSFMAAAALGSCLLRGEQMKKDEVEAKKWLDRAGASGVPWAEVVAGVGYLRSLQDEKAMAILERAEKITDEKLRRKIADAYYERCCAPDMTTNSTAIIPWYKRAAQLGNHAAQQSLFGDYSWGPLKDEMEAAKWAEMGAKQGDPQCQSMLAFCYKNGFGVPQADAIALRWERLAAEGGFPPSQCDLGERYMKGDGVVQDFIEGYKWFNIAAVNVMFGNEAASDRDKAAARMTAAQIAEGQKRSVAFRVRGARKESSGNSETGDAGPTASGSGFFVTADGYFVTAAHVVRDASELKILTHGQTYAAKLVASDGANDLALLKALGTFAPLPVVPSRHVKLGDGVATVGFPNITLQGRSPKFARGEIAALSGAADDPRFFQISVPIQPGNSGGAVVDERACVVGVVEGKLSAELALRASGALPENVNFAVKSSLLLGFLESVPEVLAAMPQPRAGSANDVAASLEAASAMVLVY